MKQQPFGFIFYPSTRALAYAAAFIRSAIIPRRCIRMAGDIARINDLQKAFGLSGPADWDVPLDLSILEQLSDLGTEFVEVKGVEINDRSIVDAISSGAESIYVFSGGGILKEEILHAGKRLLHVHPGWLPSHRGSTCFYYSLLETGLLAASAFFMERELDAGPVIARQSYYANAFCTGRHPLFIDYILDASLRSKVLEIALPLALNDKPALRITTEADFPMYFKIHPSLRQLAVRKLVRSSKPDRPEGLLPVESPWT